MDIAVQNLIVSAMRTLGAASTSGETPAAGELATQLTNLNMLLETLSTDGLLVFGSYSLGAFSLVGGQLGYTIGPGGDFDTVRPMSLVEEGNFIRINNTDYPLAVVNYDFYLSRRSQKSIQAIPDEVAYDPNRLFPLGNLAFYPTPDQSYHLVLNVLRPLSQVSALTSVMSLPEGYAELLKWNLAKRAMADYPCAQDTMQLILNNANETLAAMKRYNVRHPIPAELSDEASLACNKGVSGIRWMQTGGYF